MSAYPTPERIAYLWHTDARTVTLFYKFAQNEILPHEFLNRLLSVKDSVEFTVKQEPPIGLPVEVLPDQHADFLGAG